jgi:Zn-dependent metalloprotease
MNKTEVIKMIKLAIQIAIIVLIVFSLSLCNGGPKEVKNTQNSKRTSAIIPSEKSVVSGQDSIDLSIISSSSDSTKPTAVVDSSNVNRAFVFLEGIKNHYRINNPRTEFTIRRIINDNGIRSVIFDQVHNGVKVRNGYFTINLTRNDSLSFNDIVGFYEPEARTIDTHPTISIEQAKQIVTEHPRAKGSGIEYITKSELIIGRFDNAMRLVWAITMFRTDSGIVVGYEFFIDAQNGSVLEVQNKIMY